MNIEIVTCAVTGSDFAERFEPFKSQFFAVLAKSHGGEYYGDDYHFRRIVEGRSTLYIATTGSVVVGVSYVKTSLRRGATAVFPEQYRRLGIAEKMVLASLYDFPQQYTIVNTSNTAMISLLKKVGFKEATSVEEIKSIAKDEFSHLIHFETTVGHILFQRYSIKRATVKEHVMMLHTFK